MSKQSVSPIEEAFLNITFSEVTSTSESDETSSKVVTNNGKAGQDHTPLYKEFIKHSSAIRVDSDVHITNTIRSLHPNQTVVVSRDYRLNLFGFPEARITRLPNTEMLSHVVFLPPPKRSLKGRLGLETQFGTFNVKWGAYEFLLYSVRITEHEFNDIQQLYFIHDGPEAPIQELIMAASTYASELHEEVLVFNDGWWQKDHALWLEIQKANWDDVILDSSFKKTLQKDVDGFFKSEQIYRDLAVPWKRGVIFLGPPGNGKTISLKAILKGCPHPALYVKSFRSWAGEEASIREIFRTARRESPCILVLEDLDSLINDGNRSFFLNEIDGLEDNNGILVIGTTNYFERLDPSLSKRPSRFDRKFTFDAPNRAERVLYAKYWQQKLKSNHTIAFPDNLTEKIADLTDRFSFAFMKEAFISTLILMAGDSSIEFVATLEGQITALRKTIDNESRDKLD